MTNPQTRDIGANVPRLARRSPKPLGWVRFPTVPASGRVAPGQCETVVVMAHMEMTMLAENCACLDASRPVLPDGIGATTFRSVVVGSV